MSSELKDGRPLEVDMEEGDVVVVRIVHVVRLGEHVAVFQGARERSLARRDRTFDVSRNRSDRFQILLSQFLAENGWLR